MANVEFVEIVMEWLLDDLSHYDPSQQEEVLNGIEKAKEHIEVWGRDFTKIMSIIQTSGEETIYRQVISEFRAYYVRERDTLYCIGVGPRKKTYDRDIDKIKDRAGKVDW